MFDCGEIAGLGGGPCAAAEPCVLQGFKGLIFSILKFVEIHIYIYIYIYIFLHLFDFQTASYKCTKSLICANISSFLEVMRDKEGLVLSLPVLSIVLSDPGLWPSPLSSPCPVLFCLSAFLSSVLSIFCPVHCLVPVLSSVLSVLCPVMSSVPCSCPVPCTVLHRENDKQR